MHMADALLAPGVAGVMYACSAVAAGRSVRKLNQQPDDKAVPVMGVMGAFVFAAQMINFTIPGTGSSGHLCGGMLLAAIVGPYAAFLTVIGVLLIQCLLFADGGLMALGANIWNMAFYGCFVGGLIWRTFTRKGLNRAKIIAASLIGCILSLQLGAFSVSVETLASGITALPFGAFLLAMQPIHLAIGAVEGDHAVTGQLEEGQVAASPGMKYKHYSPKALVYLVRGSAESFRKYVNALPGENIYAMVFAGEGEGLRKPFREYGAETDHLMQARELFWLLREFDDLGAQAIYVRCPSTDGVGLAVYNRLIRAAAFRVIKL